MKHLLLYLFVILSAVQMMAQTYTVSGTVIDSKTSQPMPGAMATATQEGQAPKGTTTDENGKFSFSVKAGSYAVKVSFLGYLPYEKTFEINKDLKLGTIKLSIEDKELDEVKAVGILQRQEQRGDTTVFNAAAFKVNPDATTEDLLKKMPGMQVSGGSVKSGGETVKKVLVDGKEYFGDDPMAALRNIQADMVSKIEVYDRQSDQSEFTGFSDGNEERTINIMTKMGITSGYFGRLYGGYGTDDRYELGGNINYFRGDHRFSVIGMLNNVNQQNFSFDDVTGAMANGGGGRGMFNMGQSGKNKTGSIGLNYTLEKEKKIKIETSYFYNYNKNSNETKNRQDYFIDEKKENDSLRVYNSESDSEGKNYNHRVNLRLTWTINDRNSIIFSPRISWQDNEQNRATLGQDNYNDNLYLVSYQGSNGSTTGLNGGGNLMWRHKMNKDRRTISINFGSNVSTNNNDSKSYNIDDYAYSDEKSRRTSQNTENESSNVRVNASANYTEPIGDIMALQINYSPSYTRSKGDKVVGADTMSITTLTDKWWLSPINEGSVKHDYEFSSVLSNKKTTEYWQHRAGLGLNIFKGKEFNATVGLDFQQSRLTGSQEYPIQFETDKSYSSLMPSAMIRVQKGRAMNMRLNYRTSTNAPSISNLQKVVDVSNSRNYRGGNENLNQSYTHNIMMFLAKNNVETSRAIFMMMNFSSTRDYIAQSSLISSNDTVIDMGILLPRFVEYTKPVNMNGYWSGRVNLTLSSPVTWLGSNVNLNLGTSLSSVPSLYNGKKIKSDTYNFNGGLTIGSSFSENVDFTVSYDGGYNVVKSTSTTASNYNYYNHSIGCDLTCYIANRFTFSNHIAHQYTTGMGRDYDKNYLDWNASVGCKFFQDRRAELKLRVNDILDNSQSVSRQIQTSYVQTTETDVLRRYAMLTFTYKIKPKSQQQQMEKSGFGGFGGGRPPMGPPPGAGRGGRMF